MLHWINITKSSIFLVENIKIMLQYGILGTNFDDEVVYFKLFPFSLREKTKIWLQLKLNIGRMWKELARFFPQCKYISAKAAIVTFSQGVDEHLCEAWER